MSEPRWFLHFAWGRAPYALDLPEVTVGRGDGCPLQVDDTDAAYEHARFIVDDDQVIWLDDLESGLPTLVNSRRITGRVKLSDGDFVQIGQSVLTLRTTGQDLRRVVTSRPDARTIAAEALPEQVRRALAEKDAAAKNFVVGTGDADPNATLMMEPLTAVSRAPQQTIEASADELMASVRRDAPGIDDGLTMQESAVRPQVPDRSARLSTMMGVGPAGLVETPTLVGAAPMSVGVAPVASSEALTSSSELAAAPTMVATAPSLPAVPAGPVPRRRGNTQADLTPLPAPAPPSVPTSPDLRDAVRAADAAAAAPLSSAATQLLAAVTVVDAAPMTAADAAPLSSFKTQPPMPALTEAPHVPPAKGAFGSFSRAIDFFQQMLALARRERVIAKPIVWDLAIATPISLLVSLLLLFVHSQAGVYLVLSLGTALLYFVDYLCNAMTASLIYDQVMTGHADLAAARARVKRAVNGILIFAAVSAVLDVASTYARERRDLLGKILLPILRAIWTTATYVIMPALVIEGVPFKDAFARSKKLMDHDPTGVGAGVVAMSLVSYLCAAVIFPLAFLAMRLGSHLHPIVGVVLFFTLVNVYWAISGWTKIAYSTCFYLWAQRCEKEGRADTSIAPPMLRHAIDAG